MLLGPISLVIVARLRTRETGSSRRATKSISACRRWELCDDYWGRSRQRSDKKSLIGQAKDAIFFHSWTLFASCGAAIPTRVRPGEAARVRTDGPIRDGVYAAATMWLLDPTDSVGFGVANAEESVPLLARHGGFAELLWRYPGIQ